MNDEPFCLRCQLREVREAANYWAGLFMGVLGTGALAFIWYVYAQSQGWCP